MMQVSVRLHILVITIRSLRKLLAEPPKHWAPGLLLNGPAVNKNNFVIKFCDYKISSFHLDSLFISIKKIKFMLGNGLYLYLIVLLFLFISHNS